MTQVEDTDRVSFSRNDAIRRIEHSAQIVKGMTLCQRFHYPQPSQQLGSNHWMFFGPLFNPASRDDPHPAQGVILFLFVQELMTTDEAASLLHIAPETLRKW